LCYLKLISKVVVIEKRRKRNGGGRDRGRDGDREKR
jgi:hypothetical protein